MPKKKSQPENHNGGGRQLVKVPPSGSFMRAYREAALKQRKPTRTDRDEQSGRFQPSNTKED